MIKDLKELLNADESLDEFDLKLTAQMLLTKQFLLRIKPRHRRHFDRVLRYQNYYRNLMEALNHRLVINENHGYVGITPEDFVYRMKLEETLILLSLRYIYDDELNAFNLEDDASVRVSFEDFEDRYLQLTQREMPKTSTVFREYLKGFASHGVLDIEPDEFDPSIVKIRIYPTISELLTGNIIEKIAGYLMAEDLPVVEKSNEDEIEENDSEPGCEQP